MSREEFENSDYMVAVGVDRATSAFVQVWKQPHMERDEPLLVVDSMGVRTSKGISKTPAGLRDIVEETRRRFTASRISHPNVDAETIVRIVESVGFSDLDRDVYRILDGPM